MRKFLNMCMLTLTAAALAAGCSNSGGAKGGTASDASEGSVTLGPYKGVEITRLPVDVTEEEVRVQIDGVLDKNADYVDVTDDRPAEPGDLLIIDFVGKRDGAPFEGGSSEGYKLKLGSGQLIPGFEDGLAGSKVGDKVTLNLTFPKTYHEKDLAGVPVVFDVTVKSMKARKLPELNDEFVKKATGLKTVDELQEDIRTKLQNRKKAAIEQQQGYEALSIVSDSSQVICPKNEVDETFKLMMDRYNSQVAYEGKTLEDVLAATGMDRETFEAQVRVSAERMVKQKLVMKEVAEREKIAVEDADRQLVADQLGVEDVDTLIGQSGKEAVDEAALNLKVMKFLVDNAVEKES